MVSASQLSPGPVGRLRCIRLSCSSPTRSNSLGPLLRVLVAAEHSLHGVVELDRLALHGRIADILTVGER